MPRRTPEAAFIETHRTDLNTILELGQNLGEMITPTCVVTIQEGDIRYQHQSDEPVTLPATTESLDHLFEYRPDIRTHRVGAALSRCVTLADSARTSNRRWRRKPFRDTPTIHLIDAALSSFYEVEKETEKDLAIVTSHVYGTSDTGKSFEGMCTVVRFADPWVAKNIDVQRTNKKLAVSYEVTAAQDPLLQKLREIVSDETLPEDHRDKLWRTVFGVWAGDIAQVEQLLELIYQDDPPLDQAEFLRQVHDRYDAALEAKLLGIDTLPPPEDLTACIDKLRQLF